MEKKLKEKNEDIVLIVTSDHGLIETGHGGGSDYEKLSLLFSYSSRGFASNSEKFSNIFSLKKESKTEQLTAYDLTEMIAYYMGATPPYNSLGSFKAGFLPLYKKYGDSQKLTSSDLQKLYSNYQFEVKR